MKVFVYGTLKKGYGNSGLLSGAKFLGVDAVEDHLLILPSFFPYAFPWKSGTIYGEVYEVDEPTLRSLDRLEGYPTHYQRKQVETTNGHKDVYMYYLDPRKESGAKRIKSMLSTYTVGNAWSEHINMKGDRYKSNFK